MAVPLWTIRVYKDGIRDAHNDPTVRYGACTVHPVKPQAPITVYNLMVITTMIFEDNVYSIWR